jgi:hypothetical protein
VLEWPDLLRQKLEEWMNGRLGRYQQRPSSRGFSEWGGKVKLQEVFGGYGMIDFLIAVPQPPVMLEATALR